MTTGGDYWMTADTLTILTRDAIHRPSNTSFPGGVTLPNAAWITTPFRFGGV